MTRHYTFAGTQKCCWEFQFISGKIPYNLFIYLFGQGQCTLMDISVHVPALAAKLMRKKRRWWGVHVCMCACVYVCVCVCVREGFTEIQVAGLHACLSALIMLMWTAGAPQDVSCHYSPPGANKCGAVQCFLNRLFPLWEGRPQMLCACVCTCVCMFVGCLCALGHVYVKRGEVWTGVRGSEGEQISVYAWSQQHASEVFLALFFNIFSRDCFSSGAIYAPLMYFQIIYTCIVMEMHMRNMQTTSTRITAFSWLHLKVHLHGTWISQVINHFQ